MREEYRTEVKSVKALIQRVACEIANRGYVFYAGGQIPEGADPAVMEGKLEQLYGYRLSKHQRYRRKREGLANHHLVRFGRAYWMFATPGESTWFEGEEWPREVRLKRGRRVKDFRKEPFCYGGYQIGVRRSLRDGREHVSVRIVEPEFEGLVGYFLQLATTRSERSLQWELSTLPFEPYTGIRRQYAALLRQVNALRQTQGLEALPQGWLPRRRVTVKTFEDEGFIAEPAGRVRVEECQFTA